MTIDARIGKRQTAYFNARCSHGYPETLFLGPIHWQQEVFKLQHTSSRLHLLMLSSCCSSLKHHCFALHGLAVRRCWGAAGLWCEHAKTLRATKLELKWNETTKSSLYTSEFLWQANSFRGIEGSEQWIPRIVPRYPDTCMSNCIIFDFLRMRTMYTCMCALHSFMMTTFFTCMRCLGEIQAFKEQNQTIDRIQDGYKS